MILNMTLHLMAFEGCMSMSMLVPLLYQTNTDTDLQGLDLKYKMKKTKNTKKIF